MMKAGIVVILGAALGTLAACDNGNGPPLPQASTLRALHAARGGPSLTLFVDGARGSTLAFGQMSRTVFLSPGEHDLVFVPTDTTHSLIALFNTTEGVDYSVFATDSIAAGTHTIDPVFVLDTGAVPAAGHGRLRITSVADSAPAIDAHRTQPDSAGLVASAQPLNFRAVTPYFDGAAGAWSVVISHAGMSDTLLATGSIPIADGQAWTVVVLDSITGRVSWRLMQDRD
ncbi:MAG TPA: DUF4397 domain-containing protein [Gemmatimonadales bacterium]|nr:DUF4397 domain-containing protein [Gemmatimonadales bacterium]